MAYKINNLFKFTPINTFSKDKINYTLVSNISKSQETLIQLLQKIEKDLLFPKHSMEDLNRSLELLSTNYIGDVLHSKIAIFNNSLSEKLDSFDLNEYVMLLIRAKSFSRRDESKYLIDIYFNISDQNKIENISDRLISENDFLSYEGIID